MDEILDYYKTLREAYENNSLFFGTNRDHAHNAMVMRLMLEKSNNISMFCGEMSVFRKKFYDKIRENNPELGDRIEKIMIDTLNEFVRKDNAIINIILTSFKSDYLEDLIVDGDSFVKVARIMYLPKLSYPGYDNAVDLMNHFSFTEDRRISRVETKADEHEAILMIGEDPSVTDMPAETFEDLRRIATPVSLK